MKKNKFITIVIRGCKIRVDRERAAELQKHEAGQMRKDWNNNVVD